MDEYVSPNICPVYQMLLEPLSWLCSQLEDRQWLRFPSQTAWGRWHIGAKAALKAQLASQPATSLSGSWPATSLPVQLNHWLQLLLDIQVSSAEHLLLAASSQLQRVLSARCCCLQPEHAPNGAEVNSPAGFPALLARAVGHRPLLHLSAMPALLETRCSPLLPAHLIAIR